MDARTGDPDEVDIDRTYLAFGDPQPPVGTLITLRMVGINSPRDGTARVTHDNAWPVCCPSELECEVDAPPEPPDDSNPDGGAGEPPDVSNPPDGGSTEGPGDSTAPGEPPGISQPSVACALATGRRGGASATWLMLLLLGAALRRPRSVSGPA